MVKLILLDLDDTLLRSDKTISPRSLRALRACRERGILVGFSTARGEVNAMAHIGQVRPDVVISGGGALVRCRGEEIYACTLSAEEVRALIRAGREAVGGPCEITVTTRDAHYWNYGEDSCQMPPDWGEIRHTDFTGFAESALKVCMELTDRDAARRIAGSVADCRAIRFSDCDWFQFSKSGATKEKAVEKLAEALAISPGDMAAFGNDYGDIGMLRACGTGVAVANAIDEVKAAADVIVPSNDDDGVAGYLEGMLAGGAAR